MFCNTVCLFGFTGVARGLGVVIVSAVRIGPRLVRFSAHATRWNFGEVECSRIRFLDMVGTSEGGKQSSRAVAEFDQSARGGLIFGCLFHHSMLLVIKLYWPS